MDAIKKPVLQRLFFKLQWVAIPLIIMVTLEYALRKSDINAPLWYSRADVIASRAKIDFLFIGSSKMAAAVNEEIFDYLISAHFGRRILSLNLGQAYSSAQMHYLGLRNLMQKYPTSFDHVTLFIEARADFPYSLFHTNWKSKWFRKQPQLLVPLLRQPDLVPFWKTRDTTINEKVYITLKYLMARSTIIGFRERIRKKIEQDGQKFCARIGRLLFRLPFSPEMQSKIRPSGGIKDNPKDLENTKEIALKYYAALSEHKKILDRWDKSVLADIVRLIKRQGGKVIFLNLPAHSAELNAYRTPTHETNKVIIKEHLKKWGAAILTPDFAYTDDDIPDYFHLGISRNAEFSKKLALAYIMHSKKPKSGARARIYSPSRYSGGKWLNGINIEEKNQFFIMVAKDLPTPIKVGFWLKFAAAGAVTVQNVHRLERTEQSVIFVRIDKKLDPADDGFPFPVYLLGGPIKPSAYSDGKKWKNGIQMTNKRILFFILNKSDSFLLRTGDLLRFQQSGQVSVERISRSEGKDGSLLFFVQVDRDLDPDADGYPHTVEMIFRD